MRPQEIIAKKRDGGELSNSDIDTFIDGVCDGSWADYQISALVMAMFTRGLNSDEQDALTYAMLHSGETLDLSAIARPKADKHSTGGVGDKTSLLVAPIVAACGVAVPMISGRGLGHTGGTLDKLESIPGYRVNLSVKEFSAIVDECGFAMMGQTDDIAPADKKLYALRDATATVPYIPLIVASIMSKKLAEGLDALVLDVKTGSGAFMSDLEDSVRLANAMVRTGRSFDVTTQAVVSDMSQPLGYAVGNANEVVECIKVLKGDASEHSGNLIELSLELSARMLLLAGAADDLSGAMNSSRDALASGKAFEVFQTNCSLQGASWDAFDDPTDLLDSTVSETSIEAKSDGYVRKVDALTIGKAIVEAGGGRMKAEDGVDHAVGFDCFVKIGDEVRSGDTLGIVRCRTAADAARAKERIGHAFELSEEHVTRPELIKAVI